jgi:uncharacterized protein (TIGR03435 family)
MRKAILAIFLTGLLLAQSPQFEVASVRLFAPGPGQVAAGLHFDGAQVRGVGLSLRDYLATAYRFKATLISGPDWTATERYDISATLPDGGTKAQVPEMLQALLADRFQVKLHKEKKEFSIFALVLAKGPQKLKELPPDPNEDKANDEPIGMANVATIMAVGNGVSVQYARGASISVGNNRIEVTKLPLWVFCRNLERYSDRQIVDMTGLTGSYTFTVDVTPEVYQAMLLRSMVLRGAKLPPEAQMLVDASSPSAIGDALEQVGLKLEQRKAPLDIIVIDSALKTPTAN